MTNVTFSYPSRPGVSILNGIDLHIKAGQTIGLVGPSGCGKSTLLHVMQRLYMHTGGKVTIDDVDIKDLSISWLRRQVGVVSQEPLLFNVSIGENISYGKAGATPMQIEEAARAANAYEFISNLPEGFNTLVGDGGAQLSATSALDSENEKEVQAALDRARIGRTTVIIAHRLSTIQSADVIVAMEKGKIVEMGSHSRLMERKGLYYKLVQKQTLGKKANETEFANFYRQSVKKRVSFNRQQIPSTGGGAGGGGAGVTLHAHVPQTFSTLSQAPPTTIRRSRAPSAKQMAQQGRTFTRKPTDYALMRVMSDMSIPPPTPKTPKFSPHNIFELDREEAIAAEREAAEKENVITKAPWRKMLQLSKPDWWLLLTGLAGFALFGVLLSALYVLFSEAVEIFSNIDRDEVIRQARLYSILYAVVGFVGLIINFVATYSLCIAADRLTTRLRQKSFETIMKQDMSFFDEPQNSVSILTGRLAIDTTEVNQYLKGPF
uniref:ABC transmembrane type-1 domain-containing protein n=1 Tax=Amphimedon queenslandica TaxID=400682 RepID=A0A1X7SWU1_AMPQE